MDIPPGKPDIHRAVERKSRSLHSLITSTQLLLVPYTEDMVDKYCGWFQDDHLCQMTSTDASSIRDAFTTWTIDSDKIMFIVLDRRKYESNGKRDAISAMIGDVNLVVNRVEPGSEEGSQTSRPQPGGCLPSAEVMLMIAEPDYRGKGLGTQILHLIMRYGLEELGIDVFTAQISNDNTQSLSLFQSAGFLQTDYSKVFEEHTLTLDLDTQSKSTLVSKADAIGYKLLAKPDENVASGT